MLRNSKFWFVVRLHEAIIPFTNAKTPYKDLIQIVQFVWQLYDIKIWSEQFLRKLHCGLRK